MQKNLVVAVECDKSSLNTCTSLRYFPFHATFQRELVYFPPTCGLELYVIFNGLNT